MALIFVSSSGSNTSPYETWAKAATSLQTALSFSAAGDIVVIQYDGVPTGDAELSADTTYTFNGDVHLISASNDGGSAYTPTVMGTANWIGNSTTNRGIILSGSDRTCYIYGITLRTAGSTTDNITPVSGTGASFVYESSYIWHGNTNSGAVLNLGGTNPCYARYINCTFRFGNTGQNFVPAAGRVDIIGGSIASAGSAPTTLIESTAVAGDINFLGCDLSHCTGTLMGDSPNVIHIRLDRCKLGSGVTLLAAQSTNPTLASPSVWMSDCHNGDTHLVMGYYDALGAVVSDYSLYFTSGAAAQSWAITTTSLASFRSPFQTPWMDWYNQTLSSMTPYIEILRNGSATAYNDDQVWAEFTAKTTSGFVTATRYTDKRGLVASSAAQANGAGLGSWTGEGGTAWSGKVDSGSAFTPAEIGYIRARINVGVASATVYVDPQPRT